MAAGSSMLPLEASGQAAYFYQQGHGRDKDDRNHRNYRLTSGGLG